MQKNCKNFFFYILFRVAADVLVLGVVDSFVASRASESVAASQRPGRFFVLVRVVSVVVVSRGHRAARTSCVLVALLVVERRERLDGRVRVRAGSSAAICAARGVVGAHTVGATCRFKQSISLVHWIVVDARKN
jgi:hypothetical protein